MLPAPRAEGVPGGVLTDRDAPAFDVHLDNFTGPFDLLLGLVSRRRLDITEVALAAVTDEFIAHLRRMLAADGPDAAALGQASGFLVVAATLLDLKAARLLPDDDDAPDDDAAALLEARDLLFARLLQHRAYAHVGARLRQLLADGARGRPRPGGADAGGVAQALPELVWTTSAEELAALAAAALIGPLRRAGHLDRVDVEHLHAPAVSVEEQVALLRERLLLRHAATPGAPVPFAELAHHELSDGVEVAVVVGRFLAVLELYRRGEAELEQSGPDGVLRVRWSGVVDLREVPREVPCEVPRE